MKMEMDKLLNQSGIREALREQLPHIDKLESLDGLKDLRLTGINVRDDESFMGLHYEAIAAEGFYPHVRARLIDEGIGSKNKVTRLRVRNKGTSNEYEIVQISFSDAETILKVYNPDYSG